ncbi:hypothetical protein LJC25_04025 [Bacteroidales bacterium OttesenSCG-928-K03]|nr:hypothetical protein [Bacteroidales bacterium OttesenSCG-928-L14]MDL2240313.1 hypothetical protein [Bacteroidales bacterium OttesenSCG-928-K22]MDL2242877.1 hypothetical protein [Bacteroidales bacterium OttesenSCG-928-K03]
MDSTKNDNIYDLSKDYLTKKANIKSLIIAGILLLIGIVVIVLSFSLKIESSTASTILIIGICIAIVGIVLLITGKKRWITKKSGSKVDKVCLYFDDKDTFNLTNELEKANFSNLSKYATTESSGLRIIGLVADDGSFAAIRLEKYIPYIFELISENIIVEGGNSDIICSSIKKLKNKK